MNDRAVTGSWNALNSGNYVLIILDMKNFSSKLKENHVEVGTGNQRELDKKLETRKKFFPPNLQLVHFVQ